MAKSSDGEVKTSLDDQGQWGGNLDIRDVCASHRIQLPIYHPGSLFFSSATDPAGCHRRFPCSEFRSARGP